MWYGLTLVFPTMNSLLIADAGRIPWLVAYASIQDTDLLKKNEANMDARLS